MVPDLEANDDNFGDEAILMSTHSIQFHHKMRKFS